MLSSGLLISCDPGTRRLPQLKENYSGKTLTTRYHTDCIVKEDLIDQLTGVRFTELEAVQLFTFTHGPLKEHFKSKPFMVCEASLSRAGKQNYFLNLTIKIQSRQLNANYLGLAEGSLLQMKLINNDLISLFSMEKDTGKNISNEVKMYSGTYLVPIKELKKLRKFELIEIGLHWNGGYEKYDVHQIDFFKTQLDCLSQIR